MRKTSSYPPAGFRTRSMSTAGHGPLYEMPFAPQQQHPPLAERSMSLSSSLENGVVPTLPNFSPPQSRYSPTQHISKSIVLCGHYVCYDVICVQVASTYVWQEVLCYSCDVLFHHRLWVGHCLYFVTQCIIVLLQCCCVKWWLINFHFEFLFTASADFICTWSGQLPPRQHRNPTYSTRIFVGGVPWDITEAGLMQAFRPFGSLNIEWPGKEGKHCRHPPKGELFLYQTVPTTSSCISKLHVLLFMSSRDD